MEQEVYRYTYVFIEWMFIYLFYVIGTRNDVIEIIKRKIRSSCKSGYNNENMLNWINEYLPCLNHMRI